MAIKWLGAPWLTSVVSPIARICDPGCTLLIIIDALMAAVLDMLQFYVHKSITTVLKVGQIYSIQL